MVLFFLLRSDVVYKLSVGDIFFLVTRDVFFSDKFDGVVWVLDSIAYSIHKASKLVRGQHNPILLVLKISHQLSVI